MTPTIPPDPLIEVKVIRKNALLGRTREALREMTDARDAAKDPLDSGTYPSAIRTSYDLRENVVRMTTGIDYTLFFEEGVASRRLSQMAEGAQRTAAFALAMCLDDHLLLQAAPAHLRSSAAGAAKDFTQLDAYCTPDAIVFALVDTSPLVFDRPSDVRDYARAMSQAYTVVLLGEPSAHEMLPVLSGLKVLVDALIADDLEAAQDASDSEHTIDAMSALTWQFRMTP